METFVWHIFPSSSNDCYISFAMVWDVWIAYVGGGKLERRDKLLISHIDGVAHGRKMKSQHPEKVSHTQNETANL